MTKSRNLLGATALGVGLMFGLGAAQEAGAAYVQFAAGSISTPTTMFATSPWSSGSSLNYTVSYNSDTSLWKYVYELNVTEKDISHFIVELSPGFKSTDLAEGSTTGTIDTYTATSQGNSNPGIPGSLYGIKFNYNNVTTAVATVITSKLPEWGDFYAKDGKSSGSDVYAYNTGFSATDPGTTINFTTKEIGCTGNATVCANHILRPDTAVVPVPAALPLLLTALGALGVIGRKKIMAA